MTILTSKAQEEALEKLANFRVYVANTRHDSAVVSCGSYWDAKREFHSCRSIDGGTTHLQCHCPLLGWVTMRVKA